MSLEEGDTLAAVVRVPKEEGDAAAEDETAPDPTGSSDSPGNAVATSDTVSTEAGDAADDSSDHATGDSENQAGEDESTDGAT
jgi:hypothetical protein